MKIWDKIRSWLYLQINGGYKPSDVQQMNILEFKELCKTLDAPTKPVNCRCYCPYCKCEKGRMND